MTEAKINGHVVEFYDNIKNLPMRRYQQSNKHLMIAADIGSDFSDFDKRSIEIVEYLQKGMIPDAVKAIENRRQMVWNAFTEYNPRGIALALMVHSIDGKKMDDISESGLKKVLDELEEIGYTYGDMTENLSEVKKKSIFNLKRILNTISKLMKTRFTMYFF